MSSATGDPSGTSASQSRVLSKLRIIKNLVVVAVGCVFLFASGNMVLMYQSTLNMEKGVGIASMAVQYAFDILSSFFLPKYLVLKYGSKHIMLLGVALFLPFLGANYYPIYPLMLLASMLLGVGYSVFWGALDPYINNLAGLFADHQVAQSLENETAFREEGKKCSSNDLQRESSVVGTSFRTVPLESESVKVSDDKNAIGYDSCCQTDNQSITLDADNINIYTISGRTADKITDPDGCDKKRKDILETTTVRFFGFHSMIYQTYYVLSNLTSYFVLQRGYAEDLADIHADETCVCGASYCNVATQCSQRNLLQPSHETRNGLFSTGVVFCVLAGFMLIFLDDLERKVEHVHLSMDNLMATFREMKKKRHLLLTPLTVNIGLMQGFYMSDFTKSYIGCSWGIQYVGLVSACAGVTMALAATLSGWCTKHLGRVPVFATAAVLNGMLDGMLLTWHPDAHSSGWFFVAAGLWGASFGIYHTQVRALYGVLFKANEEAAFGAFWLWFCLGCCLCFSASELLCNDVKLYVLVAVSSLGFLGYLAVERMHARENNSTTD